MRSFPNDKYRPNGQEYFIKDMTKKRKCRPATLRG